MAQHGIAICSCGTLIWQCRCPGPHQTHVVQDGCPSCKLRKVTEAITNVGGATAALAETMKRATVATEDFADALTNAAKERNGSNQ